MHNFTQRGSQFRWGERAVYDVRCTERLQEFPMLRGCSRDDVLETRESRKLDG